MSRNIVSTSLAALLVALCLALSACGGSSSPQSACEEHVRKMLGPVTEEVLHRECAGMATTPTKTFAPPETQSTETTTNPYQKGEENERQIARQTREAEARRQHLQEQAGIPTR